MSACMPLGVIEPSPQRAVDCRYITTGTRLITRRMAAPRVRGIMIGTQLDALTAMLTMRGLQVRRQREDSLVVRNPAGGPDGSDHRGRLLSPGLRQEVACRPDGSGRLWWFWVWSGATRTSPPEYEPLCPAEQIERAADRVARVLAVPFADAGSGS